MIKVYWFYKYMRKNSFFFWVGEEGAEKGHKSVQQQTKPNQLRRATKPSSASCIDKAEKTFLGLGVREGKKW